MKVVIEIDCMIIKGLPNWDVLSDQILHNIAPVGARLGAIPEGVSIRAELTDEEKVIHGVEHDGR